MSRSALIILIVIVIAVIGVGTYALSQRFNVASTPVITPSPEEVATTTTASSTPKTILLKTKQRFPSHVFFVQYTSKGFSPATVEISPGDSVVFVNASTASMRVVSNPSAQKKQVGFAQAVAGKKGSSYSYTFTTPGSWTYHNALNTAHTGNITVLSPL